MQQINPQKNISRELASFKIQRSWRSFTNKKIYRYYRDIILFKCKGNPAKLLKAINPNEAQLLDPALKVHLRFRLGGESFPPIIYYKIFHHGSVCDVNSFAPRDYAVLNRDETPMIKIPMKEYAANKPKYDNQGWYLRMDNNGWRPISNKHFLKADYVELYSANKIRYYHHKKDKREEKVTKKKRLNKLRWLQNMYKNARREELEQTGEQGVNEQDLLNEENLLKDPRLIDMDEKGFDEQVKDLLEWSDNLDYEKYLQEWFQLSTSNASENYISSSLKEYTTIANTFKKQTIQYVKNSQTSSFKQKQ